MRNIFLISSFVLLAYTFDCWAGLDTLIEVAKSQAEIQKQYAEETRAFEMVKKAIDSGAIAKGQSKSSIKQRYGSPVVATDDSDDKREKWIYKPATSSFFKGIRAVMFFAKDGTLDEFQLEER